MSRFSRRRFLLAALALGAAGGGLMFQRARRRPRDPVTLLALRVRERLSHLELEPGDLERFAKDFLAHCHPGQRRRVENLGESTGELAERKLEREIISSFLRGSDYFDRGEEPTAAIYVAFPDPYEIGCANPLARQANARETPRG